MFNVRSLANKASRGINKNSLVSILRAKGYTIGTGKKQIPAYENAINGYAQAQALDNADLQKLEGLNIQGVYRAIYLCGPLHGVIRKTGQGGDIIKYNNATWLVLKILETWPTWTKAAIVEQIDQ